MIDSVEYRVNTASVSQNAEHLSRCDAHFVPPLSSRVGIEDYARKIVGKATRFEAWSGGALIGLVAAYCNDQVQRIAYITSVSVLEEWKSKGIAACLIKLCIEHGRALGMRQITLEVARDNMLAIKLYEKNGFVVAGDSRAFSTMSLSLNDGKQDAREA